MTRNTDVLTALQEIFSMIITSILPALSDPSNAYNAQHIYVLQSLAQVKSIILVTDIPGSETLILHLFTSFFDTLSGSSKTSTGEQLPKNVEYSMTAILVIMVDESPTLPPEAVDTIVAQFLRTDPRVMGASHGKGKKNGVVDDKQSTLVLKELPPAYNMAKTICNSCEDKMAQEISKYFNDVIMDASASSRDHSHRRTSADMDDIDDSGLGPTEEDMKELYKAHRLLRELWRACPTVLQNVIPQLEAELSAENLQLRLLATETLGDIVSGIGAAGPPPPPILDPAAYPPIDLTHSSDAPAVIDLLTTPSSPQSFPQAHPHAYTSFLSRRQDKSAVIRSAWTTAIGRILTTSAGGVGLSQSEEQRLVEDLARMLNDSDEKVRIAAIKAIGGFSFRDVIGKLGSSGSTDTTGSVLANLAERVKDKKHAVRVEATQALSILWGVAAGEIAEGNEQVTMLVGSAPSKILNASYVHDMEINVLLDHVFYESLLPLSYPPIKSKALKQTNGNSQVVRDSQTNGEGEAKSIDPDKIRTERILLLVKYLDERAKKVFFARCSLQAQLSKYLAAYLQSCEDYNGGVMDKNEASIKDRLTKLISELSKLLPDPTKVSADLWKFAKMHDRRSYQLIRFCMAPESDYRTVFKAFKEFSKRLETSTAAPAGLLDTLTPLLYRTSIIIYNKSHVPAIMEFSKTDAKGLGNVAHEVLKDISARTPEVLKAHVQEMCRTLQEEAPTSSQPNVPGAVDNLKACAAFAKKFPSEIPQDRKFTQAMVNFALHGSPPEAAKYAVSIIMAACPHKETIARELAHKCVKGFKYGSPGFIPRLASLSQLWLLAPAELDAEGDATIDIAIKEILLQVRAPSDQDSVPNQWAPEIDEECSAKCWALKILANRIRSHPDPSTLQTVAEPVYTLFSTLISNEGELSTAGTTPPTHRSRLRLLAARLLLKLCTSRPHETLLAPAAFNDLAEVAQDALFPVRSSFLERLKKYLAQTKLPPRFYTIPFLLAFEPDDVFKAETVTWIKSRAAFFASLKSQQSTGATSKSQVTSKASTVLESAFARLLSLLAHHPDYGDSTDELLDSARYIMFYLTSVANEDNISLIFHIAQRVKGCRDLISSAGEASPVDFSTRLYVLSDLAQTAITALIETHGWSLQTLPTFTRLTLPKSLFGEIKDHETALNIAEKNFLPEGVVEGVEALVRSAIRREKRGRKRKSEAGEHGGAANKRAKSSKMPIREGKAKTGKKSHKAKGEDWDDAEGTSSEREGEGEGVREMGSEGGQRRRSGRVSGVMSRYVERDDEEDERELEELNEDGGGPADAEEAEQEDDEDGDNAPDDDVDMPTAHDAPASASASDPAEDEEMELEQQPCDAPLSSPPKAKPSRSTAKSQPSPATKAKPPPAAKSKAKPKAKAKAKPPPPAKASTKATATTTAAAKAKASKAKAAPATAGGRAMRSRATAAVGDTNMNGDEHEHENENETEAESELTDAPDSELE
jgi:sister-chromatid-cohesion protein PDS5